MDRTRRSSSDAVLARRSGRVRAAFRAVTGQTVGQDQVHERLGRGGMGSVYRAIDTRLRRPVALKFLLRGLAEDPIARARFVREAQAPRPHHPHIATVFEIGEHEGALFLGDGLLRGRLAPVEARAGSASGGRRRADLRRAPPGAGGGARCRDCPPRPQAGEPDAHRRRTAQADSRRRLTDAAGPCRRARRLPPRPTSSKDRCRRSPRPVDHPTSVWR